MVATLIITDLVLLVDDDDVYNNDINDMQGGVRVHI